MPQKSFVFQLALALLASAITASILTGGGTPQQSWGQSGGPAETAAAFVGSGACTGCHQAEASLWRSSQHQKAMAHATNRSVLGDFSGATFDYFGVKSRFFRKNGAFMVETDGPDGRLGTFEIKYTFGVHPLQQYLIGFPDGRLQALSIAWDSRSTEQGGQRWFHLYPDEPIRHNDPLHWSKLNQNWNFMCAECHSTGVHKNYDAKNDSFATSWAEISVGCEACHGRGSRHVAWAVNRKDGTSTRGDADDATKGLVSLFDERRGVDWHQNASTGQPERSRAAALVRKEVETCGLCHARRSQISEGWVPGRPLSDTHVVSMLEDGSYFPDGQMRDEVYNYGSFKQSKMFAAGVTCSDCHDPHSAQLRASGDTVCLQCHAPDRYAAVSHHHHDKTDQPVTCASCHMPQRTYMVVDRRHDHSFRVPRPDASEKIQTPNACTGCHTDKSAKWAAQAIEQWHGPRREGFQKYGNAFAAAWAGQVDASSLLEAVAADPVAPAFARASALKELTRYKSSTNLKSAQEGLSDPDPMVRIGALDMLAGLPSAQILPLVSPLLSDAVLSVRIRAVSMLADFPFGRLSPAERAKFERAEAEFIAAQRLNDDRPEAHATLGNFYAQRGRTTEAEAEYKNAVRLNPQFAPAAINLADLYRHLGRDADSVAIFRQAIASAPNVAELRYGLGLALTRIKKPDEALDELRRASELDPGQPRYAYVYAVGLHSAGRQEEALKSLEAALQRFPDNLDLLMALVTFNRDAGSLSAALRYGEQLAKLLPNDSRVAALLQELRSLNKAR